MAFEKLALWGGVECTINRVGDKYHQQLTRSGHLERSEDIDAFADLGMTALRVPILWELAQPDGGAIELSAFDPMLERVRRRNLRAIAGLVHHGSGPRGTHLEDATFEHGIVHHARAVAARYPWIQDYTPVNEPLTTARFSSLYGHWYPHNRDHASFLRALLNETRATIRAMQAIREIQPQARLVQTEDTANITSSALLRGESDYQNARRWLSLDLLCGRVDRAHELFEYLRENDVSEDELGWIRDHACPPDIIGANYYFTSDRHLDERVVDYPAWAHVHNGPHPYADVHASVYGPTGLIGHRAVLQALWDRYEIPIAITEVHAGSTREEQLRWLKEAWDAAHDAREHGIEVIAVTAWALLGSFDWGGLVMHDHGLYEPGVFDLRSASGRPRPTALAKMIKDLASHGRHDHPVLDSQGWWRRGRDEAGRVTATAQPRSGSARPILITGAANALGQAFVRACEARGLAYEALSQQQLDIGREHDVDVALQSLKPWALINAADFPHIDEAEAQIAHCLRVNAEGPRLLAAACRRHNQRLVSFSSDLVFDGRQRVPYLETAPVAPLSLYGKSKVAGERGVLRELPDALVVRTSALFGAQTDFSAAALLERSLREGAPVRVAPDRVLSPTYLPHLVHACLDLLIDGESGIWHLVNRGAVSWADFASRVAECTGIPPDLIEPCCSHEATAPRPEYSVLGSGRGLVMPTLDEALKHFVETWELPRTA